ncbi:MAG: transcription initiation factor IIB, partial [Promethearchaeota archaeon]
GLELTQKDIAEVVGVTEVTLRSRYKELSTKLKIKV